MDELLVEHVLRAVEAVPPGRVTTYGAVARLVGTGARHVGSVMRYYGSNVAWWRVVAATGALPPHLREEGRRRWRLEGIATRPGGAACRLADHRVDEAAWAAAYRRSVRDLPAVEPGHAAGDGRGRPEAPRR